MHPRAANACESCRRRKVRCSGDQPCRDCVKHKWECIFGDTGRKRYSEAQVKKLLDKIESYEERLGERAASGEKSNAVLSDYSRPHSVSAAAQSSPINKTSDLGPRHGSQPETPDLAGRAPNTAYDDGVDAVSPDLTSGPAFVSQVRSLLDRSNRSVPSPTDTRQRQYGADQFFSKELVHVPDEPSLPSMKESQHLLDQFLFYLGVSQHFFDSRLFSDSMMLLFQSPESRDQQKKTIWYSEYLLVMAMAKLIDVEKPTSTPPGSNLFAEAIERLPPLHVLGSEGVLAIEILTLIATYFQWCDQKHNAYLHIGLALRLSIALGCNIPENEQNCIPSQSTHRLRLWWTVYMLDRRLSSSLGLAAGADERQLKVGFPRHAIGFQSPVAIMINIRIARVTDDIMSSLYGKATVTQVELVRKVQSILQELHDIARSIPQSLTLDFSRPLQGVTRTGSSLYLMLFQAIILCTRPMLLHRVRLEVQQQDEPQSPAPEIEVRFCDTCNEAATRSLAILYALRRQRTIPRYGFFDLEATFSAAFVLVMAGFINKTAERPPPSLEQAFEVLRFLSRSGNSAAGARFQDITQSCQHVWPEYVFDINASDEAARVQESSAAQGATSLLPFGTQPGHAPPPSQSARSNDGLGAPDVQSYNYDEIAFPEPWEPAAASNVAFDLQGGFDFAFDLSDEAEGIYSSFYNPTLSLTGVDYMDWLEIEKVLNDAPSA